MKKTISLMVILVIALFVLSVPSCKDDEDYTHVSAYEKQIHDLVNVYRSSQGLNELVLQFVMVKEAQDHSADWAGGLLGDDPTQGLTDRFLTIIDKIGGTDTDAILSVFGNNVPADTIVNYWINHAEMRDILEGTYTQSGPGIATDKDGLLYITHLFLNVPSK